MSKLNRGNFLARAEQIICRDREDVHGAPEASFGLMAEYWSTYLTEELKVDVTICDADVAVMMALFKIARLQCNPRHQDNVIDGIGYLAIAGELIENTTGSEEVLNFA